MTVLLVIIYKNSQQLGNLREKRKLYTKEKYGGGEGGGVNIFMKQLIFQYVCTSFLVINH